MYSVGGDISFVFFYIALKNFQHTALEKPLHVRHQLNPIFALIPGRIGLSGSLFVLVVYRLLPAEGLIQS
jgi:hypothetical protein